MLSHMIQNHQFHKLFASHVRDFISFLQGEGMNFSITCNVSFIEFNPPLDGDFRHKLGKVAMFVLSGYSFESIHLGEESFSFEAGLISDQGDIGTILEVPYVSVLQILLQDESNEHPIPIYINPFEISPYPNHQENQDSIKAILSKNASLLKGKQ